jgi:hypothetical protein
VSPAFGEQFAKVFTDVADDLQSTIFAPMKPCPHAISLLELV